MIKKLLCRGGVFAGKTEQIGASSVNLGTVLGRKNVHENIVKDYEHCREA